MPSLSFEGETHDELVRKVRRWLASVEGEDGHLTPDLKLSAFLQYNHENMFSSGYQFFGQGSVVRTYKAISDSPWDTFQDQDGKRRLGGFESAGEHSRQQPSRLNDGQHHSR